MTLAQSLVRVALTTAFLLLIPLVAMQLTREVVWTLSDFVVAGGLLFGAGLTYVLIARPGTTATYRVAVGVAVLAGLLLGWANMAVGLVRSEYNPLNLLYGGVLAVAGIGALGVRFRPLGMARAMFGAALAYALVTGVVLLGWPPAGNAAEPAASFVNMLAANAGFAALWAVSGWLFWRASTAGAALRQQPA